uniref:Histone H4 n=1 Tax=Syphacia muris TaxID=451379 RepID=A0A0N5B1F3_9BILA
MPTTTESSSSGSPAKKNRRKLRRRTAMIMAEEGGYLGAMTYQCLFKGAIEQVMQTHKTDDNAYHALSVS